jgi:hypothetical protein
MRCGALKLTPFANRGGRDTCAGYAALTTEIILAQMQSTSSTSTPQTHQTRSALRWGEGIERVCN